MKQHSLRMGAFYVITFLGKVLSLEAQELPTQVLWKKSHFHTPLITGPMRQFKKNKRTLNYDTVCPTVFRFPFWGKRKGNVIAAVAQDLYIRH